MNVIAPLKYAIRSSTFDSCFQNKTLKRNVGSILIFIFNNFSKSGFRINYFITVYITSGISTANNKQR
jgi:hypothetical protein